MMFQDARLLPWKTVIDNVGLGLKGAWRDAALQALASVGLESRAQEWPAALSGGQKQRVALARALILARACCCWTNRWGRWMPSPVWRCRS